MFSGIIEDIGIIRSKEPSLGSRMIRFIIETKLNLNDSKIGDSIAVNGACLTLLESMTSRLDIIGNPSGFGNSERSEESVNMFLTEISPETAQKTNLDKLEVGEVVNLERAMQLSQRVNGHLVSGHIDAVISRVEIESVDDVDGGTILWFELPDEFRKYLIVKGSVSLNGVSLTVNKIEDSKFSVFLIPHTIRYTNLIHDSSKLVNLEVDMIGKFIEQFVKSGG